MSQEGAVVQRLRIAYGVSGPLRYLSVLDMGLLWERLFRRARVPLAYTQGFNPRARMQFASALPVGYSSDEELLDIYLCERMIDSALLLATTPELPIGLQVKSVVEVSLREPPTQALLSEAHYRVSLHGPFDAHDLNARLQQLLARPEIMRQRIRKGKMVRYDLRPLICSAWCEAFGPAGCQIHVIARCGASGSGRPEDLLDELGLSTAHYTIHRTRLVWEGRED